jgi:hypothetical protein
MTTEIRKRVSPNDLGETGSHQAGVLVPKRAEILDFFPRLDHSIKNPRTVLLMTEEATGGRWKFNYIYYNGKLFGGTRNEYRLTGMTGFLRIANVRVGDEIVFSKNRNAGFQIGVERSGSAVRDSTDDDVLVLSGGWKIIKY